MSRNRCRRRETEQDCRALAKTVLLKYHVLLPGRGVALSKQAPARSRTPFQTRNLAQSREFLAVWLPTE